MRRSFLLGLVVSIAAVSPVLASTVGPASPCPLGNLGAFVSMGACTIGPLTFRDFNFGVAGSFGNPNVLGADDINVSPIEGATTFGLNFQSPGFSVGPGQSVGYMLGFSIDP